MDAQPDDSATLGLLRALLEASDEAIFTIAADGSITACNRSAERIFGVAERDIVGQRPTSLFVPHARDEVTALIDAVRAGDVVHHYETEIEHREGSAVPVSLSAAPATGGVIALVLRDITERQINQATLAEFERRVRDSEALAQVGVWLWDIGSGTVQWTEELHRIHGIDPLDFDGTIAGHLATVHAGDRDRVARALQASIETGKPLDEEYRIVQPDGALRTVRTLAATTADSAGNVVGVRGVARDVTPS